MGKEMPQDKLKELVRYYMVYYSCKSMRDAIQQIKQDLKEVR